MRKQKKLVFTSCALGYLPYARVLAKTFKKHNPDYVFTLVLVDEYPEGFIFNIKEEPFDRVCKLQDLDTPPSLSWMFCHNIVEACTAVKGPFLKKFTEEGWDTIIYLDPDIAVYHNFENLEKILEKHSIVITPHALEPEKKEETIIGNEMLFLQRGTYNLGFLAIRNDAAGKKLAQWWNDRLLSYCYDEQPSGLYVDQKWFDLVPGMFDNVYILRDPGYNVASWNITNRRLSVKNDAIFVNKTSPLYFYHFSKYYTHGRAVTEHYAGNNYEIFGVWGHYGRMLEENPVVGLPHGWWAYKYYNDGYEVSERARRIYRYSKELQERFPNPYCPEFRMQVEKLGNVVKARIGTFVEKNTRGLRRTQLGQRATIFLEKNTRTLRRLAKNLQK